MHRRDCPLNGAVADDEPPNTVAEAMRMTKKVTILRSSFWALTLAAAAIPAAWAGDPATTKAPDLKAPDIHAVMTSDQIAAAMPATDENEVIEPETVAVKSDTPAPYVPGGFAALYWAALHNRSAPRQSTGFTCESTCVTGPAMGKLRRRLAKEQGRRRSSSWRYHPAPRNSSPVRGAWLPSWRFRSL